MRSSWVCSLVYSAGVLSTLAAHAAFNAMNDPLGLLGDFAESWYFLVVIIAVSAAGCVLCRRGLSELMASPVYGTKHILPTDSGMGQSSDAF